MNRAAAIVRSLAALLMRHAAAVMPARQAQWPRAMRHEFAQIDGAWPALGWALGCVCASYTERIRVMIEPLSPSNETAPGSEPLWRYGLLLALGACLVAPLTISGPRGMLPFWQLAGWLVWYWPVIVTLTGLALAGRQVRRQGLFFALGAGIGYLLFIACLFGLWPLQTILIDRLVPAGGRSSYTLLLAGFLVGVLLACLGHWAALRVLTRYLRLRSPSS